MYLGIELKIEFFWIERCETIKTNFRIQRAGREHKRTGRERKHRSHNDQWCPGIDKNAFGLRKHQSLQILPG